MNDSPSERQAAIAKFAAKFAKKICDLNIDEMNEESLGILLSNLQHQPPALYDLDKMVNGEYTPQNNPFRISSDINKVLGDVNPTTPVVFLDLDETLINVFENNKNGQYYISPRPGAHLLIEALYHSKVELVLWTAGVEQHARSALALVDPNQRIQRVIFRSELLENPDGEVTSFYSWCKDLKNSEFYKKKAFDLFSSLSLNVLAIVDDSPQSLAHPSTTDKAINIAPYCSGRRTKIYIDHPEFDLHLLRVLYVLMCSLEKGALDATLLQTKPKKFIGFDSNNLKAKECEINLPTLTEDLPNICKDEIDFFRNQLLNAYRLISQQEKLIYSSVIKPVRRICSLLTCCAQQAQDACISDDCKLKAMVTC